MKFMLDCRDLTRLLSQSQDVAPPPALRARVRLHLMACRACRDVDEQMRFIRTALRELNVQPAEAPPASAESTTPPAAGGANGPDRARDVLRA